LALWYSWIVQLLWVPLCRIFSMRLKCYGKCQFLLSKTFSHLTTYKLWLKTQLMRPKIIKVWTLSHCHLLMVIKIHSSNLISSWSPSHKGSWKWLWVVHIFISWIFITLNSHFIFFSCLSFMICFIMSFDFIGHLRRLGTDSLQLICITGTLSTLETDFYSSFCNILHGCNVHMF